MRNLLISLLSFMALIFPPNVYADLNNTFLFTLNTIYITRDYNDNGIKSSYKTTDTDIRLGKVFRSYYAGLLYSQSANDSNAASRTSYGLSGGYFSEKDIYMVANYFFSSKNSQSGVFEDKGTGFEIDLGGLFRFTSSFYLGLMMAYRSFSYTDRTISGVSAGTSAQNRELVPMFTIGFALQ